MNLMSRTVNTILLSVIVALVVITMVSTWNGATEDERGENVPSNDNRSSPAIPPTSAPMLSLDINPKTNGVIYRHNKFSFEYPSGWKLSSSSEDKMNVYQESLQMSLSLFLNPPPRGDYCSDLIKSERILIDGISTKFVLWRKNLECDTSARPTSEIFMSFDHNQDYYVVTLNFKTPDEQRAEELFKRMMATFKFSN